MAPPENGLRERVVFQGEQIDRLDREKASKESLTNALENIAEIRGSLQAIEKRFGERVKERQQEREAAAKQREQDRKEADLAAKAAAQERKRDWQYKIGLALTCTGLLIAAMTFLLPALQGGG